MPTIEYNVTVELPGQPDPDDLAESLPEDYGLALHRSDHGMVAITLTVRNGSVVEAIRAAVRYLRTLGLEAPYTVSALPTDEFDQRADAAALEGDLTVPQAAAALGVSEQRIRQLLAANRLGGRKAGRDWLVAGRSVRARLDSVTN